MPMKYWEYESDFPIPQRQWHKSGACAGIWKAAPWPEDARRKSGPQPKPITRLLGDSVSSEPSGTRRRVSFRDAKERARSFHRSIGLKLRNLKIYQREQELRVVSQASPDLSNKSPSQHMGGSTMKEGRRSPAKVSRGRKRSTSNVNSADPEMLVELHNSIERYLDTPALKDHFTFRTLNQFYRACGWNKEAAVKKLIAAIEWRRETRPEEITFKDVESVYALKVLYMQGFDKAGRPVMVVWPARDSSKISIKLKLDFLIWQLESVYKHFTGGVDQLVFAANMSGMSLSNTDLKFMKAAVSILQSYYPECMFKGVAFDPPRIFPIIWKVLKALLDERTANKCTFVTGSSQTRLSTFDELFYSYQVGDVFGSVSNGVEGVRKALGGCKPEILDDLMEEAKAMDGIVFDPRVPNGRYPPNYSPPMPSSRRSSLWDDMDELVLDASGEGIRSEETLDNALSGLDREIRTMAREPDSVQAILEGWTPAQFDSFRELVKREREHERMLRQVLHGYLEKLAERERVTDESLADCENMISLREKDNRNLEQSLAQATANLHNNACDIINIHETEHPMANMAATHTSLAEKYKREDVVRLLHERDEAKSERELRLTLHELAEHMALRDTMKSANLSDRQRQLYKLQERNAVIRGRLAEINAQLRPSNGGEKV